MNKALVLIVLSLCTVLSARGQTPSPEALRPPFPAEDFASSNQKLTSIFVAGNEAWIARRYDEAIGFYDQGIAIAPNEPGLWLNKTSALIFRGVAAYNSALRLTDELRKKELLDAVHRDFREAAETATKSVALLEAIPAPAEPAYANALDFRRVAALGFRSESLFLMATRVDESYSSLALEALHTYVAAESDPERKLAGQLRAGRLLLIVSRLQDSFAEFQKILLVDPEHVEANLGAAVALVDMGYLTNDSAYSKQGLDYLNKFVQVAPDRHPLRGSAEEAVVYLQRRGPAPATGQVTGTGKQPASGEANTGRVRSGVTTVIGSGPPAAGTSFPGGTAEVDGGVVNGKAVKLAQPPYPAIAKFARAQGTIMVQVWIDEEGKVTSARAISGHPLLMAVSEAAARQSKFSPTKLSGQPVKVSGLIQYNFVAQ